MLPYGSVAVIVRSAAAPAVWVAVPRDDEARCGAALTVTVRRSVPVAMMRAVGDGDVGGFGLVELHQPPVVVRRPAVNVIAVAVPKFVAAAALFVTVGW